MATDYVMVGPCYLNFPKVFKPMAFKPGDPENYSVTLVWDAKDKKVQSQVEVLVNAAIEDGMERIWRGKRPKNLDDPIRDGDESDLEKYPYYEGRHMINAKLPASFERAPVVVDVHREPIVDQAAVHSGVLAYVRVNAYPYSYMGRNGIGIGFSHIMVVDDGEDWGGGVASAESVFADVDTSNWTQDHEDLIGH